MAAHTDTWYENQNQALGLPHGTRHTDLWYQTQRQQREAAARDEEMRRQQEQFRLQQEAAHKEQQNQAYYQQQTAQQAAQQTAQQQQQTAAQAQAQAAAQAAAQATAQAEQQAAAQAATVAEAALQAKQKGWRDDWDRINKQGIHDLDGWQSIGYQADPIAMPQGWEGGAAVPPATPPATPATLRSLQASHPDLNINLLPGASLPTGTPPQTFAATGPTGAPTTIPIRPAFTPTPGAPTATDRSGTPNALSQLLSEGGQGQAQPQPWTQQPAGQAQPAGMGWGSWGQGPSINQVAQASPATPQSWTQGSGQTSSAFGAPNQNQGRQSWMQKKPAGQMNPQPWTQRQPRQPRAMGWGLGSL
jgi:chemotaxis protein histidine kinase CheA